jgi:hypothetical protein
MTGQSSGSDDHQPYAEHPALPEQEPENPRLQDTSRGAEGFEPYVWHFEGLLHLLISGFNAEFLSNENKNDNRVSAYLAFSRIRPAVRTLLGLASQEHTADKMATHRH